MFYHLLNNSQDCFNPINHKYLKYLTLFFLSIFISFSCSKPAEKPNILFIMSDDHTSQAWGIYGGVLQDYVKNENIKRLASEGVVLNNAFCNNSICVPSRASILSGQYSHFNGVYDLSGSYHPDSLNVAKLMQQNGYETAIVGKWHLKKEPTGFDHYMVLPGQGRYIDPILKTKDNWKDGDAGGKVYLGYSTDVIADQSIKWLERRDKAKPFMLFTHFKATHEPFYYPERYNDYLNDVEIPYPVGFDDKGAASTGRSHDGWSLDILTKRYLNDKNKKYPGEPFKPNTSDPVELRKLTYQKFIKDFLRSGAAIDDNIGKLIEHLKSTGEFDNTVIIYTADQGYFLGEHSFFDKRFIYEPSLRMPFVICYPKELNKGTRIEDIILNIDFPSLLLDYAGADQPAKMQGKSFRQNLNGNSAFEWRKDMYYRYWSNEPKRPAHFGIRTDKYKLVFFYGQSREAKTRDKMDYPPSWEFYDLEKDPNELHNAINDSTYANTIVDLKKRLKALKEEQNDEEVESDIIKEIIKQNW
ncbi:Arylsulfatase A [Spirosomataceae bacterium TFI 002]|nr:Arylsulfatase A [Spirosomataceae bacterium TFI 002]